MSESRASVLICWKPKTSVMSRPRSSYQWWLEVFRWKQGGLKRMVATWRGGRAWIKWIVIVNRDIRQFISKSVFTRRLSPKSLTQSKPMGDRYDDANRLIWRLGRKDLGDSRSQLELVLDWDYLSCLMRKGLVAIDRWTARWWRLNFNMRLKLRNFGASNLRAFWHSPAQNLLGMCLSRF
jgi:hypothetical protein